MKDSRRLAFIRGNKWDQFLNRYEKSDDRSCVVLFAAYLDNCVTETLLSHFYHKRDCEERLLRESGPLGSFSARIDMLWVLGLIEKAVYRDLHLIRKIRNKFAHDMLYEKLEQEPLSSWCRSLEVPRLRGAKEMYERIRNDERNLFIVSGALCEIELARVVKLDKSERKSGKSAGKNDV